MIRVLVAEDQAMVRGALKALLSVEPDIEVVAEAASGEEAVARALAERPDVALLDIEMPGGDGISAAARLRSGLPSCRSVILTTFGRPGFLRRAMDAGAAGFLLKTSVAEGGPQTWKRRHWRRGGGRASDPPHGRDHGRGL